MKARRRKGFPETDADGFAWIDAIVAHALTRATIAS
jgi:hypothetical protein